MTLLISRLSFVMAALSVLVAPARAQMPVQKFTGFAINLNSGPSTATVDFTIERWSTDAEREQLLSIIAEAKDPTQPLLRALQKMKSVGGLRTPQTLSWDLRYAREFKGEDGGRRIVLATDRPVGFREARNNSRTMDYPFTIIEIRLDKNRNIVLENYGQQPIRFNEIHPLK